MVAATPAEDADQRVILHGVSWERSRAVCTSGVIARRSTRLLRTA